ncbi:hypothetical protein EST38_g10166 [Candolleomyces aberdarensis]|uniref:Calcineurin-like phosphoesterase domain-containing protein n=1 Tax=Candolleomyces aberdarensis TaxID=2316362 RepID=A0A4Q2DAI8_9AGAR|nr:hypothetical protein EST38_g10166 [Candolleomyces aberdarensis]
MFEIPDGDVLLHAGDLTTWGHKDDMEKVVDWLCEQKHKVKIVIAGNHDLPLHQDWYAYDWKRFHRTKKQDSKAVRKLLTGRKARKAGLIYLENQQTSFRIEQGRREWTVYGSPWTPGAYFTAFQYQRDSLEAKEIVSKYTNADIL